jgi:imidazolonepropionase-like amidohydrolase
MLKQLTISAAFVLLLIACDTKKPQTFDLLIVNASIVDVQGGKVHPNRLIAISADTIRTVDDMANRDLFSGKQVIDAQQQYVMPGLWDNHVHFRGGDSLIAENKNLLPLFLAYGVTTVRDAGGDITPSVMDWRSQVQAGTVAGPSIFSSGPKLDGENPAWAGSIKVRTESDIMKALDSLESIDVDYVKMYDGSLSKEMFYSIIKEAEKRGLKTTGHMPLSADIRQAIDFGLDGSEHIYYTLKACSPLADSLTALDLGYGMMDQIIESYDSMLALQVFHMMGDQQVFITPTLHIGKTLAEMLDVDHGQDSLRKYVGEGIQETYQGRIDRAKKARASGSTSRKKTEEQTMDMIVPMYEAGVNILAGSDCGAFNSFVYPGQSIHQELMALVRAELTPQQALITSVINGPKFFDLDAYYGSVDQGKVADLLLLDRNPLDDITHLQEIHAVIKRGDVYNKKALDKMMQQVIPN